MKRSKKKRIQVIEAQDAQGISRKKWNHTISLELFILLKLICIISIPIFYFVYSPLLVVCLLCYVTLFFLAILAERGMNKSVIRVNHIKIFKFDSAIALIIIVVALFGTFMTGTTKIKRGNFDRFSQTQIAEFINKKDFAGARNSNSLFNFVRGLKNFGSLLTGERSILGEGKRQFGMAEPPKDFPTDMKDLSFNKDNSNLNSTFKRKPNFEFSVKDLPIEYIFSSILSTVNTVLIFTVCGMGILSFVGIYIKKQKFEIMMNEIILEDNAPLSDEEIDRILNFGEEIIDNKEDKPINVEIKKQKVKDNSKNEKIINKKPIQNTLPDEIDDSQICDENIEILEKNFDLDNIFDDKNDNK